MKIYYVVPPKGVDFRSQYDAVRSFEAGEPWRCVGYGRVTEEGKLAQAHRYPEWRPMRYSQGDIVQVQDSIYHKPRAYAIQWKPGRVAFILHRLSIKDRGVSLNYGKGRGVDLRDERTTSSHERFQEQRIVRAQGKALKHELREQGGWLTSAGLRFRPVFEDSFMDLDPYPMVVWKLRTKDERMGPVYLDANPACRTLGDRELERWFESAKRRAHNPYGKRLDWSTADEGGFNAKDGNYRTRVAPDSDDLVDRAGGQADTAGYDMTPGVMRHQD